MGIIKFRFDQEASFESVPLVRDQSVLDTLLSAGYAVPHGCKSGICQSCILTCVDGDIPDHAQKGLKASQKSEGQFLSCCCQPSDDITVQVGDLPANKIKGEVIDIHPLNENIFRLRLRAEVQCQPGQFMNLWRGDEISRCYSIANAPERDDYLEFHIKSINDGAFSGWAKQHLKTGDLIDLQGPFGDCVYESEKCDRPMLLVGIGTGLAPLLAIVLQALLVGHSRPIHLVLAAKNSQDFYLVEYLIDLANQYDQISLIFVAQSVSERSEHIAGIPVVTGDVYQTLRDNFSSLREYRIFLCGAKTFVDKARRQCFMSGAAMQDIKADAFVPAG